MAAVCVYFMNGVRNDPADSRGISYLYQYLMFDGNENLESYDHVLFINKMGGTVSGRVNYDNSFFMKCSRPRKLMWRCGWKVNV